MLFGFDLSLSDNTMKQQLRCSHPNDAVDWIEVKQFGQTQYQRAMWKLARDNIIILWILFQRLQDFVVKFIVSIWFFIIILCTIRNQDGFQPKTIYYKHHIVALSMQKCSFDVNRNAPDISLVFWSYFIIELYDQDPTFELKQNAKKELNNNWMNTKSQLVNHFRKNSKHFSYSIRSAKM